MVRTTVACAACRKLKIKCVHDGSPPCRTCFKKGRVEDGQCVLTLPHLGSKPSALLRPSRQKKRRILLPDPARSVSNHASPSDDSPAPGPVPSQYHRASNEGPSLAVKGGLSGVLSVFSRKFPELRFIHQPSFCKSLHGLESMNLDGSTPKLSDRLLYASLAALCCPLLDRQDDGVSPSAEDFASYVRDHISLSEPPTLTLVQTLLVLSMYEWGTGCGYRAWTYSGMATRMMQSLLVLTPPNTLRGVDLEVYNRTFWGCFIMDRLVFCGKPQPFTLSVAEMHTHWPISEEDFAFGEPSAQRRRTDEEQGLLDHMKGDANNYYGILVRGFDIWARILKWVVGGGRRLPGMSLPENHPWVDTSPWRLLYNELHAWKRHQDRRLHYVEGSLKNHAALGQAEAVGYLNLIYYVSLIFLEREYIPFLPAPESEPSGPVDPPFLSIPAPPGWWHDRADELFTAAAKIPSLMQELEDANASLNTPFAGFCAFSAATMNLYVSSFPNMNLKRNADTSFNILLLNLRLLDKFRRIWPMGEGWWVTIQHCKRLYEHASRDTARFRGRTRDDFIALEFSIQDSRGQPPTSEGADSPVHNERERGESDALDDQVESAAASLHDLPEVYNEGAGEVTQAWAENVSDDWVQSWPLWGEQQNIPYAVGGIPFDYNLDMLNSWK
ncbi:hypothetical protein AK830_g3513 [Neonectria ditissima]|uniref:Zn(2)-C6 fungal-type domain-containing protein n=1 Tax=Neonectria ditissima TaxID=78410 RepID=A0A0P7BQ39_9HYPO|nr:hypothetical protein AK830_g3513 [Neonectria ditissima]